ncbi:MAG: asparagine synthase (glutamine-hydrolyzing) [Sphingobacteriales bacterium]|nr:asparagine synthase (glutamine-hydrolyzing) [Sphingobacteriales bacterium]
MCGIAGSVNFSLDIPRLTKDLFHRGPDQQTTFRENDVILHHHRLSILDITGGGQPKHFQNLTIIFNGEIYNHNDIRKKYGLICDSNSDTETILHAYAKLGASCLHDFDGMFAIVIYDRAKSELFLARDRAGKKPLYYYADGNSFVFASELNALRNQVDVAINEINIQQFIAAGYFFDSNTPYKNVFELPSGSYVTVSLKSLELKVSKWWDIRKFYSQKSAVGFGEALQQTDHFLHHAIKRRIESSDLEVGSFLSGGIDSGLVTAIGREYNSSLQTFTISFEGEYDEAPLAKLVADRYHTKHHEIKISFNNLLNDVEKILSNYGEPFFDSSAIPSYYVSQAARKHLTVILNGDGGDELFGGYRRYVPFAKYDFFKKSGLVRNMAAIVHKILPVSHDKKGKYNYIYRLVDFASKKGVHTYFSSCLDIFEGYEQFLVTDDSCIEDIQKNFNEINNSSLSGLQKILTLDFEHILASNLLVKMDIATMAHSLEGRSPMLSKELLEYITSLPDSYKVRGGNTKYLLRKLAEKYLPAELINQPKRGFEIPLKKWIDGELKDLVASYLLSPDSYAKQFMKKGFIEKIWDRRIIAGDEKRAKMLWTLFALDVWYNKCYLRK